MNSEPPVSQTKAWKCHGFTDMSSCLQKEHQQAKHQKKNNQQPFFLWHLSQIFLICGASVRIVVQSPSLFKDAYISLPGSTRLLLLWCTTVRQYMCIFLSPSSLYENGSNLDLRLQGYELRGQMKGAEGRSKQKKEMEESRGQNSLQLTLFSSLHNKKKQTCR